MSDLDEERNALLKRFQEFLLQSPRELLYPGVIFPVLVRLIATAATITTRNVEDEQAIENALLEVLIARKVLERMQ